MNNLAAVILGILVISCSKPIIGKHGYSRNELPSGDIDHRVTWKNGLSISLIMPEAFKLKNFKGSPTSGYILSGEFDPGSGKCSGKNQTFLFTNESGVGIVTSGDEIDLCGNLQKVKDNEWRYVEF